MSDSGVPGTGDGQVRNLTVAAVREPPGADHVEVLFLESARFYRLPRAHPDFAGVLGRLQASRAGGRALAVTFAAGDDGKVVRVD